MAIYRLLPTWLLLLGVATLKSIPLPPISSSCEGTESHISAWANAEADRIMLSVDDEVKERLALLDQNIVDYRFEPSVRYVIRLYVERWRSGSERILGRTAAYFPHFSEALAEAGMPDALKYLSITESALRPFAQSHVGAGGLWQLMPGTARELGLQVDEVVDERLDLTLGTTAGLRYLQMQYDRYGDWALAMAAYNSGPGRVNRAKRRSGSNNYWRLRRFLPRETRGYVPGFIAATYLATFFRDHELRPRPIDLDFQLTETITVFREISLHRVAMVTGLRPGVVIQLNPSYLAGYIPARRSGRYLRLPRRVMPAMRTYLNDWHEARAEPPLPWLSPRLDRGTIHSEVYYDTLEMVLTAIDTSYHQLADSLSVSVDQLLLWSGYGPYDSLATDQRWRYYQVKEELIFGERERETLPPAPALPEPELPPLAIRSIALKAPQLNDPIVTQKTHFVKRTLSDIWGWLIE